MHLTARPTQWIWHFGDGATASTSTPGRPYPARDITHRYTKAAQVTPTVDVVHPEDAGARVEAGPAAPFELIVDMDWPMVAANSAAKARNF